MALGCSWHLGPFGIMVMKGHMSKPLLFDSAKCNCPAGGPWCTYLTSGRRRKDRLWSLQRQVERETLRACQRPHISTSTLTLRVYFSNPMDDWSVSLLPGGQTGRSPYFMWTPEVSEHASYNLQWTTTAPKGCSMDKSWCTFSTAVQSQTNIELLDDG